MRRRRPRRPARRPPAPTRHVAGRRRGARGVRARRRRCVRRRADTALPPSPLARASAHGARRLRHDDASSDPAVPERPIASDPARVMTNAPARGWSGSMQRWWSKPRNRRIALVTGVLLVIVWTVALIAIARDTGSSRRKTGNLTLRRAGPSDSPAALWLFGFDTLRLDPDKPSTVEQLGLPAFGDVGGTTGGVLLYDTGSG